jgi:hypothetical protein
MMRNYERDPADAEKMMDEAMSLEAEGKNPYPNSTYVSGVKAALAWVLGESDDEPLEW